VLGAGLMRFLFRMAFWLTIVCVLLPRGETQPAPKVELSATDAMSAASATVDDLRQFCERQAEACNVGSAAAAVLEDRAKAGARRLYQMLNDKLSAPDNGTVTTSSTKAIPLPPVRPPLPAARSAMQSAAPIRSQDTLTPADLAPIWRGPPPHKPPA
jgi:hypothetical protein